MAALRSALAMIGRRSCGFSRSSAAASIGRRELEIHTAAVRNLKGWRPFSTGGTEPAAKAGSGLRMWWQRARDRMENAPLEDRDMIFFAYSLFVLGITAVVVFKTTSKILRS
ncbi:unnamed protein product [Urochloa decumbens]|uniref:Uncharacterized protein n=1 Tax=Urochloa decumbens TaxID=240449 RepID=A0ABC8ZEF7_9POAL